MMNILALLLGVGVIVAGFFLSTDEVGMFWDTVSLFIVFGGTFAAVAISVQFPRLLTMVKIFINKMLKGKIVDYSDVIKEILSLSNEYNKGKPLSSLVENIKDDFLRESVQLLADDIVEPDHFINLVKRRANSLNKIMMVDIMRFKNIGKYPPAFGMMGTTIGMIVLLANLGGKDAMAKMGPAMGVCLITTLYGVIVANMIVVPVAENIEDSARDIYLKNSIVAEGLKLMLDKVSLPVMTEELNSYLKESDRLDWKEVVG